MHDLRLRPATETDVDALVALVTSAYRGDDSRSGWTTEADLLDGGRTDAAQVLADLTAQRSTILVAERAGHLRACVHVADRGGRGYLGMFAVAPSEQGSGVGSHLMRAAESYVVEQWQVSEMEMTVISVRVELIAYYQRRGYALTGETRPFPYGQERFGVPRRDDLEFAVLRKSLI